MAFKPGEAPLTISGGRFGLNGGIDPSIPLPGLPARAHPKMIDAEAIEREGKEAGTKAGEGIRSGIEAKAPEVQQQGVSVMRRLQELFSAGIFVPINLKPGEGFGGGGGDGGIITASFNPAGGSLFGGRGGTVRAPGSNAFGGTDPMHGGGVGATNAQFTPGNAAAVKAAAADLGTTPEALATVIGYETRGTFSPSIIGGAGNHYQGLIQFGARERAQYGADGSQSFAEQMPAVVRYLKGCGFRPGMGLDQLYATINGGNPYVSQNRSDGNGTIGQHVQRMQGSMAARARSFLNGRPEIPELPAGGLGGAGGRSGMNDLREHIAELGRHVDRFGESSMHAQLEVTGLHRSGLRATGVRVRTRGGLTADMGITEPGAKSMGDWYRGD